MQLFQTLLKSLPSRMCAGSTVVLAPAHSSRKGAKTSWNTIWNSVGLVTLNALILSYPSRDTTSFLVSMIVSNVNLKSSAVTATLSDHFASARIVQSTVNGLTDGTVQSLSKSHGS